MRGTGGIWSYVLFFAVIVATVNAAILIESVVRDKGTVAVSVTMLLVILGLAAVCTFVEALWRYYMVTRPAEEILDATDRIADGDFSVRLKTGHAIGEDDYDEIKENINRMAEELSKNEILKTEFVSNVSHELKTPLAVIQNYAMLLKDPDISAEERERCAQALYSSAQRMGDLVGSILKLSRLENAEIVPEAEDTDLEELLGSAILRYEDIIEEKRLDLKCDIESCTVRTVPSYLEIVCTNLVSNAVKFTPEGGEISVSARKEDGSLLIRVSDTGCGMDAETASRIFDKFYQGDTSHAQAGNGLGLALVKKVVDILGGRIGVKSEPGKGSVFDVTLKLSEGKEDAA